MADGGGTGGGGRRWLSEEAPGYRSAMLEKLTIRLAPFFPPTCEPYSQEARTFVAKFEEAAFNGTNSKDDYIKNISNKLASIDRIRSEKQNRQRQSRIQLQRTNAPQALQGGNSSVMPEAMMVASPRPNSQPMTPKTSGLVSNQQMVYSCTPNTQIEIEQKHPGVMAVMDRCQHSTATATIRPGIKPSPRPMQSGASQSPIQHQARQPQALNLVGCSPSSVSKPAIRPNSQPNNLCGQNDSFIGHQQQQKLARMNQQVLGAKQQEMYMQRKSQLGGQNNQQDARQTDLLHSPFKAYKSDPMTPPLQQISGAQQSTILCSQIPVDMGSARDGDVMEKMFCQIKYWKDAYYSQFVKLDRKFQLPTLTEEQFSSLPIAKKNEYRQTAQLKKSIRLILKFLLLRKSDSHEGLKLEFPKYEKYIHNLLHFIERTKAQDAKVNAGYQLQNCGAEPQVVNLTGNVSQITGGKSGQEKQSADGSILQSSQTSMARTSPAHQHNNHNHLLGTASPSSTSSPGTLHSWSTSMLEFLTPSPVARPVVAPDSPGAPVISTFSKDVDSMSAFLLHDNAAAALKANSSNQAIPTKPTTPASPLQAEMAAGQGYGQGRGGDRTSVTKKPIDRLIDAMRSSSPEALRNSANSIWSVLSISDIVPHGKIGTILDCKSSQHQQFGGYKTVNKMKRVFNTTASCSELLLSGSIDRSCMSFECDTLDSGSSGEISIKRQKTQNVNDALLEEIKSVNRTLIDTVISMCDDYTMDGIASCDGGTTIKLSYSGVSLSPTVKSFFTTSEASLVLPTKLFIPTDYPSSSPVLVNHEGDEVLRKNSCAFSASVDMALRHVLRDLPEPRSIKEMAMAWDACVRKALTEFAHRHGGGTFSSMLGRWERCVAT